MAILSLPVPGLIASTTSRRLAFFNQLGTRSWRPSTVISATLLGKGWTSLKARFKCTVPCAVSMADDRRRIAKLETRAREAEMALQQLKAYIQLLKDKGNESSTGAFSAEAKGLDEENSSLRAQVTQLKQELVTMEIRNGVPQIPVPKQGAKPPPVLEATPANKPAAEPVEAPKTNKKPKEKKKPPPPTTSASPVDVSRLDLRIGRIVKAYKHPNADALYVEEVDVGEDEVRIVCSGLTKHVPLEQMQDRVAMFMCNLKPAKMRDVVSAAMIMCASTPEKVEILEPPPGCIPGDRVVCDGYQGAPDAVLNPKKKIFENVQPDLNVNDMGVACYKTTPFKVVGREGVFTAPTLREVGIK